MGYTYDLEMKIRPHCREMPPYPPKYITLASGEKMVAREVRREELPLILEVIEPLIKVPEDYYDIVAVRFYAEVLSMVRHRIVDEYLFVGAIDGEVATIVNGRMVDDDLGMSLHTITVKRGLRCGALMFASKMEYHMEYLNQKEIYLVAESPIGFRRFMVEWQLEPRFEERHELGGVPTYVMSRKCYFDAKPRLLAGVRPVPEDLLAKNYTLTLPREYPQLPRWHR